MSRQTERTDMLQTIRQVFSEGPLCSHDDAIRARACALGYRTVARIQEILSADLLTAIRDFCRWLGFARTGPIIEDTTRSLINGLLRDGRLETDGTEMIRRI